MTELWPQLSAELRRVRTAAGVSLRTVESLSGIRRGTLSLVETGNARPNRQTVEYYDHAFGADGYLLSLFAEARGARGRRHATETSRIDPDDAVRVSEALLPFGRLVEPGDRVTAGWTLHNVGGISWNGRSLRRVGAPVASGLIESDPAVPVPACAPGERVSVAFTLAVPEGSGTYAAYWQMADSQGHPCLALNSDLSVLLVARMHDSP